MTPGDYMTLAIDEARAAADRGEVPVGAIIVDSGSGDVLSRAGNRVEELGDPTAHAEILAIRAAAEIRDEPRLPDCDLYVTLEPCSMARLRRLSFGAYDAKGGGVEHGGRFFNQPTCHHAPEVVGGVMEIESGDLLKAFFAERR